MSTELKVLTKYDIESMEKVYRLNLMNSLSGIKPVNMVSSNFSDKAHYTSAKFNDFQSEFDQCELTQQFYKESKAPCVAESPLKILLKFEEEYFIKSSRTILMVGSIQSVYLPDNAVDGAGMIDMESLQAAGVSGLNTYYKLSKMATYPYARVGQFPQNQIQNQ